MSDYWTRDVALYTAGLYILSGGLYVAGWHSAGAVVWAPLIGLAASLAAELYLTEPEVEPDV